MVMKLKGKKEGRGYSDGVGEDLDGGSGRFGGEMAVVVDFV